MAAYIIKRLLLMVPTLTVMEALLTDQFALPASARDKLKSISDNAVAAIEHCEKAGIKLGMGTDLFGHAEER